MVISERKKGKEKRKEKKKKRRRKRKEKEKRKKKEEKKKPTDILSIVCVQSERHKTAVFTTPKKKNGNYIRQASV